MAVRIFSRKADRCAAGRDVHVIERVVVDSRAAVGEPAQVALDDLARRIAHGDRRPARPAIGDDARDALEIAQHRLDLRGVGNVERHARHDHAVEEALEHRWHAEAPDRKLHDQRVRGSQPPNIVLKARLIAARIVIVPPGVLGEHRIELGRHKGRADRPRAPRPAVRRARSSGWRNGSSPATDGNRDKGRAFGEPAGKIRMKSV